MILVPKKRVLLFIAGGLVGLICALILSSFFFQPWRGAVIATFPKPACDAFFMPCTTTLPSGETITLELSPTILPNMIPLSISVTIESMRELGAEISFQGVDMYMGENTPALLLQKPGHYVGKTILPICSKTHMRWHADIVLETDQGRVLAPFEFSVRKSTSGHPISQPKTADSSFDS